MSDDEDEIFQLRLTEASWEQIGEELRQDGPELYRIRTGLEEKALLIWEQPEQYYYNGNGRRKGQMYTREPNLPEEIPSVLLDVLNEQERTALVAYQEGATQEEAAKAAGISQPTVSRVIAFVWENYDKPLEELTPRTWRHKNDSRREQVMELFYSRPPGDVVTKEELLELFADVNKPLPTLRRTVSRYNGQLEGARIALVRGRGYTLVEEGD